MPGKIAHLVPMQRFDSIMVRRTLSIVKSSNTDYHLQTPIKSPPITTTSALGAKSSIDDSSLPSHPPVHTSASINSLKPSYEQATNVNNNNDFSPARLQTMLSRFRQDLELTSYRLDIKRSSV
jgi:hypothetical protein